MMLTLDQPGRLDTHSDAATIARSERGELCLTLSRRGCRVAGQGVELCPVGVAAAGAPVAIAATTDPRGRMHVTCPPGRYLLRLVAAALGTEAFACTIEAGARTAMTITLG